MQQSRLSSPAVEAGPAFGQIVLRRKWLLLLGLGLGVGLGYLYFTRQAPVYRSTAQVLVQRNRPAMVLDSTQQANSSAFDTIETQCIVVTSAVIREAAVDKHGLADIPEFGSRERALVMTSQGLTANAARKQTEVMEIAYQGSSPSECKAVLEAITKAYEEFLGDSARKVGEKMTSDIEQAREDLMPELDKLEAEYAAFRKSAPLLWQGQQGINPHAERLSDIEGQRTSLLLGRSQLQAKLDAIRDALAGGGSREALSLMVDQLKAEGNQSATVSATEKLFPLILEKELLSRELGPAHPKVQSIQAQIDLTREHLSELFDQGDSSERPRDLLDVYVDALQYEIETTKVQEEKLAVVYDAEKASAEKLDEFLTRDGQLREAIDRKGRLLDAIIERLDEIELFDGGGIRTEMIAKPGLGYRTSVEQSKHMAVGGILGLLFAVGIAYLLEVNDRSFRTPEDIRDELGAPVIGHVPVIAGQSKATSDAAAVLCTIHAPKSQMAESFRLVRTALFFGARAGNLKVIQVTSPDQGDGKSTVSSNLAVAIAQSGRTTLLIDADMRRPTVHHLFHVGGDSGLSTVIAGGVDPVDAIKETVVANLSVLPCGPRPHNPAELLSSPDFQRLLEWARDRYDFVIIDTPPLLAVSDPGNVAARVDGVVLTVRLGKRARAKAGEARQILDRFGANVLGVVINGVNARGEYGYHAAYRYTYGSSGGYGSYGRGDYLEEAETAATAVASQPAGGRGSQRRLE